MKILVAPLNWGLGHASRCVPLVQRLLDEGHEVVLGGDGESLTLLRKHFPKLRYTYLAPLNLRYSKGSRQVWAILRALPKIILWAIKDHVFLKALLREEPFDQIISDNRFGLYISNRRSRSGLVSIYITHQLHIMLPKGWRWAEGIASRLHARIYTRYNKVWIPDYEDPSQSLAGELTRIPSFVHCTLSLCTLTYIGPLTRYCTPSTSLSPTGEPEGSMESEGSSTPFAIIALLSGLEPHRTLLEQEIIARYAGKEERVLIVQGLMHRPNTRIKRGNITIVPYMSDDELAQALCGAKHIIARSGYSTIMDLNALGLLKKAELIPTPGQPEQEYLAAFWAQKSPII